MSVIQQFEIDGQKYSFRRKYKHLTQRGEEIALYEYEARCPDCGEKFRAAAPKLAIKAICRGGSGMNRRCQDCKKPGRRVRVKVRAAKMKPRIIQF